MKKISVIISAVLFITACQKDKNSSSSKTTTVKPVIELSKEDSSKLTNATRPISLNATCTPLHASFLSDRGIVNYIVIGSFPATKSSPTPTLPRQTWVNGNYRLVNQADGNLILYKGTPSEANLIWKSASNATNGSTNRWFRLQTDMNMVEYDVNTPVWSSRTQPYECPPSGGPNVGKLPGNTMLILTNDGDLEIVANALNAFGNPCRAALAITRTSGGAKSPNVGSFYLTYTSNLSQPFGPGSLDYNN